MALRANFMVLEGRAWTALAHTDAVSEEVARINFSLFWELLYLGEVAV